MTNLTEEPYNTSATELVRYHPMLKLSKRTDYGLIALKHLAMRPRTSSASAKEIAGSYRIPVPLLSKVLQALTREGFLESEHGTRGGYRLARDPGTISALEVIRAIDGPIILTSCFTDDGDCEQSGLCTVREPLRKVHEGIVDLLDSITISDMAGDGFDGRDNKSQRVDGPQIFYTVHPSEPALAKS